MKYKATEREWVRKILCRLTPEQRERYEEECERNTEFRHRNGKLYDVGRAKIAERIILEDREKRLEGNEVAP